MVQAQAGVFSVGSNVAIICDARCRHRPSESSCTAIKPMPLCRRRRRRCRCEQNDVVCDAIFPSGQRHRIAAVRHMCRRSYIQGGPKK